MIGAAKRTGLCANEKMAVRNSHKASCEPDEEEADHTHSEVPLEVGTGIVTTNWSGKVVGYYAS